MTLNTRSDSLTDITRVLINNLYPTYKWWSKGKSLYQAIQRYKQRSSHSIPIVKTTMYMPASPTPPNIAIRHITSKSQSH